MYGGAYASTSARFFLLYVQKFRYIKEDCMNKFTQAYLDAIRSQLEEEKKNITVRISELTLQDPFSDPDRLNDNAASDMEASEESNHDRFQALLSELREKLGELDDALVRIQKKKPYTHDSIRPLFFDSTDGKKRQNK